MNRNHVEQTVSMNNKRFVKGVGEITSSAKSMSDIVNKSFEKSKVSFKSLVSSIGKDGLDLKKHLKNTVGNMAKGGALAGLTLGFKAVSSVAAQAAKSTMDFDRQFARTAQRFDLSKKKISDLRKEFRALAEDTGVTGGAITGAANQILSATQGKSTDGIKNIAEFSKLGDNLDATDVSRKVIDYLKGSGQEVTGQNIGKTLQSALALSRKGDFNLGDALGVVTGANGNQLARAGLDSRQNAALIAGASNVGQDRASTTAAIQALIEKSVAGFGKGSALQGILGVEGGSLLTDGKFDVSKLAGAAKNFNQRGMSEQDTVALLQSSGLSDGAAEGLYSILKDFDTFQAGFEATLKDQKSIEDAFKESTNNLPDALNKLIEKINTGVDDITKPLTGIGVKALSGDFAGALGDAPGAISDSFSGMADNKALVATILGGTAITGGLLSKLGIGGSAAGVAKGLAVEKATGDKIQAVHVTNAAEIGSSLSGITDAAGTGLGGKLKDLLKSGKGHIGKALGSLGTGLGASVGSAGLAATGGAVVAGGVAGYGLGTLLNDKFIKDNEFKTKDGFEGNIAEQAIHGIAKLFGSDSAKKLDEANRIFLEIDSKDNGFKVKPTRQQNVEIKGD